MFQLVKSLFRSIGRAVVRDPEVRSLEARHPRFFAFLGQRLSPDSKFGLSLTLGALATLFFIFLFFGFLQDLLGQDPLIQLDLRVINLLQIFRTPWFNSVMLFITYLGKWPVVLAGLGALGVIFLLLKRWHEALLLLVSVAGGEFFVWLLKHVVARPRPPLVNALAPEAGFSFPSGHSFVAIAFYGLLGYFLFRAVKARWLKVGAVLLCAGIIAAIGFSRVYLGSHWPSDVLASYASAAAWLSALITAREMRRQFDHEVRGVPFLSPRGARTLGIVLFVLWGVFVGYFFKTHPLKPPPAVAENRLVVEASDIPQGFFPRLPRVSEDITGRPMEPINVVVVASRAGLDEAFARAGWLLAEPITSRSSWRFVIAAFFNQAYPNAPGTPSFWDARPNDFAYEHETPAKTVRERQHIHFWATPFGLPDGRDVWFATAHFDKAIALRIGSFLPLHTIDPAVDRERDKIVSDLAQTGLVETAREFSMTEPRLGANQAGDQFFTDGKAFAIFLKH